MALAMRLGKAALAAGGGYDAAETLATILMFVDMPEEAVAILRRRRGPDRRRGPAQPVAGHPAHHRAVGAGRPDDRRGHRPAAYSSTICGDAPWSWRSSRRCGCTAATTRSADPGPPGPRQRGRAPGPRRPRPAASWPTCRRCAAPRAQTVRGDGRDRRRGVTVAGRGALLQLGIELARGTAMILAADLGRSTRSSPPSSPAWPTPATSTWAPATCRSSGPRPPGCAAGYRAAARQRRRPARRWPPAGLRRHRPRRTRPRRPRSPGTRPAPPRPSRSPRLPLPLHGGVLPVAGGGPSLGRGRLG